MSLPASPLKWPAEAIWAAVEPLLPRFTVEVLPEIDSTNTELMRRARSGQFDPVLLVAERQLAGRGRMGRAWQDNPGAAAGGALSFSLGLALAPASWSGLSLAAGVSVAQNLHPKLRLKWPNDVWLDGCKLAGILIETASFGDLRYAVIGVGINIAPRDGLGLSTPPAWAQALDPALDAPAVLQCVAEPLVRDVLLFQARGFAPFQARFAALDALANRAVSLSDGTTGQACGVDECGALRLQTPQGIKTITSAEVSVRPAP